MPIKYEKLLSIAIPTYNRAEKLKQTLECIIRQIEKDNSFNAIEIIVSDNASSDNTQEVVNGFIEKYSELIIYSKNESNIGFGRNIEKALNLVSAKYIWFCSDDDIIYDGLINKLINVLSLNNVDYCLLNIHSKYNDKLNKSIDLEEDICLDNISDFFDIANMTAALVTANIFSKKILEKIPCNSYTWYHIDKLFNYPHNSNFYIINEPYIMLNPNPSSWINYKNSLMYNTEIIESIAISSLPNKIKIQLFNYYKKIYFKDIYKAKKNCKDENINYDILAEKLKKTFAYDKNLFYLEYKILKSKKLYNLFYRIAKLQNMLEKK